MKNRNASLLFCLAVVALGIYLGRRLEEKPAVIEMESPGAPTPSVGPLAIPAGARLRIHGPEAEIILSETGAARIVPAATPEAERSLVLDPALFERLKSDIARLSASWAARQAGLEAQKTSVDGLVPPDPSSPGFSVDEISPDGTYRPILRTSPSEPGHQELLTALAPLNWK